MIILYQPSNSTPQIPARVGEIPSIPTLFPITPQPVTPTNQRHIDLRNGKKVAIKSKDNIKRLQDERKRIKKLNDKHHRNHFGEGGSKST